MRKNNIFASMILLFAVLGLTACDENNDDGDGEFKIIKVDGKYTEIIELQHVHNATFNYSSKNNKRIESRFSIDYVKNRIDIIFRFRQYGVCITPEKFHKGFDSFGKSAVDVEFQRPLSTDLGENISGYAKVVSNDGNRITVAFNDYKVLFDNEDGRIFEVTIKGKLSFKIDSEGDDCYVNICPDDNHPHSIDLGIGVKWACCNVGAMGPAGYGGYYAWGEVSDEHDYPYINADDEWEKRDNWEEDYLFKYYSLYNPLTKDFEYIGKDISGTQYDVAHVKWGGKFRMPTLSDFENLVNNCTTEIIELNGIRGMLFQGPNGNLVFFPCGGSELFDVLISGHYWRDFDWPGYYWSATLYEDGAYAYILQILTSPWGGNVGTAIDDRPYGLFVRPVSK